MTMKGTKHQGKAIAILAILLATSFAGLAVDKTVTGSDEKTPVDPKIKMSAPTNGKEADHIGALVARLNKNLLLDNGIHFGVQLPVGATAEEVLSKVIEAQHKNSPLRKKHKVVEVREVTIYGNNRLAVLLDYPDGLRIFLCRYQKPDSWLTRFYEVPDNAEQAGAGPPLDDYGDFMPLLATPRARLSTALQEIVNEIKATKIPSPEAAEMAALTSAADVPEYMRDARMIVKVKSLRRIGREIPEFGRSSDFVWFVHAEMLGAGLVQVFCVNARTGKVIRLFPEKKALNEPSEASLGSEPGE